MSHRILNFSAGPATLPREVLEEAQRDLVDYRGSGMSVMEMSHRSPLYDEIHQGTLSRLRSLLSLPDSHHVLLLQGGASLQFAMVPMNLLAGGSADYVLTGAWSKKALKEARRVGSARVAASGEEEGFSRIPASLDLAPDAAYVHLTSNNTIFGTQWHHLPDTGNVPLVVDMSSDILSQPFAAERCGLIYAGAQKNLGPAGVTVVIVRDDLLQRAPETLPTLLDYRTHVTANSLFNTPPCFAIYVVGLVCRWLEAGGGLVAVAERNRRKADRLYAAIDGSDFYRGTADPASRSQMNVTFRLPEEAQEKRFLAAAAERGLVGLKGHRSVGGIRASIYNAMPEEGVTALVDFMQDFAKSA